MSCDFVKYVLISAHVYFSCSSVENSKDPYLFYSRDCHGPLIWPMAASERLTCRSANPKHRRLSPFVPIHNQNTGVSTSQNVSPWRLIPNNLWIFPTLFPPIGFNCFVSMVFIHLGLISLFMGHSIIIMTALLWFES